LYNELYFKQGETMKKMLSIAAVAALATSSFAASDLAGAFKEGKASGQIRAMYMSTDYSKSVADGAASDNSAFAVGGKLKYETASLYGISLGTAFYTTQDLGTKNKDGAKVDPYTFDGSTPNQKSYSLLGEAYVVGQFAKTTVKVGRQTIDTPLAGSDDIRMIPNLFEAALVINTDVPDTTLIGGYVSRMAGLDSHADTVSGGYNARTGFQSMSRAALGGLADDALSSGHKVGDKGVYVAAVVNSSIKDLTLQAWDYDALDVVNAIYLQADYKLGLGKDMALNLAGQYYNMDGLGQTKDMLKALGLGKLNYSVYGAKASLETPLGLTPYLAYNKVSEQKDNGGGTYVFGAWGGYPEFAIGEETWYNSFGSVLGAGTAASQNLNGAQVWKAGVDYSLSQLGLGDRTIGAAYTSFDLKNQYNGGVDADTKVWDVKYTCKGALVKNLDATLLYESADSKNNLLDNKKLKAVFNYNF
jgi:imipenem/basic amino acid-specific outer membrane pore